MKFWFIKWKFGLQPYNASYLWITLITAGALAVSFLIPAMAFWPDLIIRSGAITLVFSAAIYLTGVSAEVNSIADGVFRMIGIGRKR